MRRSRAALESWRVTVSIETSVVLLIDFQQRLMPAIHDAHAVVANAKRLASAARLLGVPVLATVQNPEGLGSTVADLAAGIDAIFPKNAFDASREPQFSAFLSTNKQNFQPDVIVAGCEAHVCVLQTVMGLRKQGNAVRLVRDAIGSRTSANCDAAIARAATFGAEIVTTEMVIFEWLLTAKHPKFRDVLKLVK